MPTDFGEITAYHRGGSRPALRNGAGRSRPGMLRRGRVPGLSGRALGRSRAGADDRDAAGNPPATPHIGGQATSPGAAAHSVYRRMLVSHSEGIKRIALAIRQPLPKRTAPIEWLSLR